MGGRGPGGFAHPPLPQDQDHVEGPPPAICLCEVCGSLPPPGPVTLTMKLGIELSDNEAYVFLSMANISRSRSALGPCT